MKMMMACSFFTRLCELRLLFVIGEEKAKNVKNTRPPCVVGERDDVDIQQYNC